MNFRAYGRNGQQQVSEIGLGGHREGVETGYGLARSARFFLSADQRARVVGRAIDHGVTYFDTTFGCELASLGESLRLLGRREGLCVSAMRVDFFANLLSTSPTDVRTYTRCEVEARLKEFGLGAVDQFMLGAMEMGDPLSHPRAILDEALDELAKLRQEGKIRFVGFSCHSPDYAARLLEAFPTFDAVMTPYSFANRQAEGRLAEALRKTGAAWIAMKTLVWHVYGIPVTVLRHLRPVPGRLAVDPGAPIGRLALRFALDNPLLTTCVPAMNSVEAVDENTAAPASKDGELTAQARHTLAQYAQAMTAEDFVPLAIGGLLEDNARVRAFAIGLLAQKLGWEIPPIDWNTADADRQAHATATTLLARLREAPRWSPYLR